MALFGIGSSTSRNPNEDVERLFNTAREARLIVDRNVLLNVAFFLNWQYVEWNKDTKQIRMMPLPSDHKNQQRDVPRPVSNKIQHFVLQEHAMSLNTRPTADVLPTDSDPMSISNANVLLAYLNWLASEQVADFDGVLSMATLWALAGAEGWIKAVWNPDKTHDNGKGRGEFIACSPLDVYPDPYATSMQECRYIFHKRFLDVEKIWDKYGVEVPPTPVAADDPNRAALMAQMGMATVLNGAPVTELWMLPSRRHPNGLFKVWSSNKELVPPVDYPYDHLELPFAQIGSIPMPGQLHFTCAVETMRPEQMELNNYHAQTILLQRFHSNPKWWIAEELQLQSPPNDSPNQILRGSGLQGLKPELIQPGIPPNIGEMGSWLKNEMMDSVGIHEVSQAQVPGRVEAAAAIELLKESDNGRLAELTRTQKKAIATLFYQQARLVKQFGTKEMVFNTYSPDGFPEVQRLWTQKINPGIQVRVTMQGGIGQSRAAREDRLMNMWTAGIITDANTIAQQLDIPLQQISPDAAFDIRQQRNENLVMMSGHFVQPHSWENHELHLKELNNYRKTAEWRQASLKVKQMFEAHSQLHQQLWVQELGKELQRQQLAAAVSSGAGFQMGAGGPPGAPGQPAPGGNKPGAPAPPTAGSPALPPPPTPNAFGAQPPVDPFAARDTPQYAANTRQRTSAGLSGTSTKALH